MAHAVAAPGEAARRAGVQACLAGVQACLGEVRACLAEVQACLAGVRACLVGVQAFLAEAAVLIEEVPAPLVAGQLSHVVVLAQTFRVVPRVRQTASQLASAEASLFPVPAVDRLRSAVREAESGGPPVAQRDV